MSEQTKAEVQLDFLRTGVDCLCEIGDREPEQGLTAVKRLVLKAMAPIRELEAKLVRQIEAERIDAHVRSSDPTPGLVQR